MENFLFLLISFIHLISYYLLFSQVILLSKVDVSSIVRYVISFLLVVIVFVLFTKRNIGYILKAISSLYTSLLITRFLRKMIMTNTAIDLTEDILSAVSVFAFFLIAFGLFVATLVFFEFSPLDSEWYIKQPRFNHKFQKLQQIMKNNKVKKEKVNNTILLLDNENSQLNIKLDEARENLSKTNYEKQCILSENESLKEQNKNLHLKNKSLEDEKNELEDNYRKKICECNELRQLNNHDFKFFKNCSTDNAIKKRYRLLSQIYHPDSAGGDSEIFKKISNEYSSLM